MSKVHSAHWPVPRGVCLLRPGHSSLVLDGMRSAWYRAGSRAGEFRGAMRGLPHGAWHGGQPRRRRRARRRAGRQAAFPPFLDFPCFWFLVSFSGARPRGCPLPQPASRPLCRACRSTSTVRHSSPVPQFQFTAATVLPTRRLGLRHTPHQTHTSTYTYRGGRYQMRLALSEICLV